MGKIKKFEQIFESFDGEAMYHSGAVTGNYARMMDYNNQNPAIELEEEQVHTFKDLEKILLDKAGEKVIETFEEDLVALIKHGDFFELDDYEYEIVPMRQSQCHANSATFYSNFVEDTNNSEDEISIVTGWALSDDDVWYQHSWLFLHWDNIIIETTERRKLYYGYILRGKELGKFIDENW